MEKKECFRVNLDICDIVNWDSMRVYRVRCYVGKGGGKRIRGFLSIKLGRYWVFEVDFVFEVIYGEAGW